MTSPIQARTSRQNGAKSHGPATAEGKAKSARNAFKHGLSARAFTLHSPEEQREFNALEAELCETYLAVTGAQKRQATQMAIAMWRQGIAANMEMALITAIERGEATANEGGAGLPSLNSILRYRARIERDLKQARETLLHLQAARVKMFEHKLKKAKEFKELSLITELRNEIGGEAFSAFCLDCTNEPNPTPQPTPNREQRRRLEAISRQKSKNAAAGQRD